MKLICKRIVILTVFLISIIFVNAAEPADCNNAGGIWCGSLSSGICLYSQNVFPSNPGTVNCVVAINQEVNVSNYLTNYFNTNTLMINNGISINFYYQSNKYYPAGHWDPHVFSISNLLPTDIVGVNPKFDGGSFGNAHPGQYGGYSGGNGGFGGNTSSFGFPGINAAVPWRSGSSVECGGWGAVPQTRVGANIQIVAQKIIINGVISVNGWNGYDGMNARCNGDGGYGGGGGSGGSGAGTIRLYSQDISGQGMILLIGGKGGNGGQQNNYLGSQCSGGSSQYPGGGGGGGGGGAGGILYATSTPALVSMENIKCNGGLGGSGGCPNIFEHGEPGSQGEKSSGTGQECIILIEQSETECNNNLDDDYDFKIDFADPDCQVQDYCPDFTSAALINGAANDGSDGCCGDDPEGDYGYVTPNNDYLCYNNKTNFYGGTIDKWMWIYAPEKPFIITPLNVSGRTVDYISNSEKWYYCNANPITGLKGLPIDEYKTFSTPDFGGLMMTCSEAATFFTTSYNQLPYKDCATAQLGENCCTDDGYFNVFDDIIHFKSNCYCRTSSMVQETLFCDIEENQLLPVCNDMSFTEDQILTEFCAQNPRNCVTIDIYDTSKSCSRQPFQSGHVCEWATQVCSNGIVMSVLNNEQCCIGSSASCIDKSQIITQQMCEASGGQPYIPSDTIFCLPENQSIYMSQEEGACCFGAILYTNSFPLSLFENINNNTFSCFAYQGNNIFGQCCYGKCNSMNLFNNLNVDSTRNRAFSIKLPFNIQNSYDIYNVTGGILQDFSWKTTTPNFDFYQIAYFSGKKNISMAYYDYLEFDILYNQLSNVKNIYINDIDYGSVTQYVNNGENRGISHHVKIPLRPESKMDNLRKIKMKTNSTGVSVLYDNIYFSISADTAESSLNYYCTGGFASWIKDLDPPITDINNEFFIGENAYAEGYGRYALTCNKYLAYGWTGHRCCGDDTTKNNYGEYYEDSATPTWPTEGGCFAGSKVINGETVWKMKGYIEDNTKFFDSDDELKSYTYADLIYYDNKFMGCQIPNNKYSNLKISYDGNTLENTNLVDTFVNDQCAVIGKYYCINGVWRQYIPGLNQEYDIYNNVFLPSIPSQLELKSVPPATNLIKNGDFGGECPPTVCSEAGGNVGQ